MNRISKLFCAVPALGFLLAFPAPACAATCVTDMDCPTTTCGGQVCQWLSTTNHVCQDAGSKSHGSDGWCNTAADCKCQSVGAKCNAQFSCSFTLPADAPPAGGAGGMSGGGGAAMGGTGGATVGSGGTLASGGSVENGGDPSGGQNAGTAGTAVASAGSASTMPTAGTANQAPDGPIMGSPSTPDSGGCAVSETSTRASGWLGFIFWGGALFLARRQRKG